MKINFGILLIILKSSKILLLFDKNLIIQFDEALNISKNIFRARALDSAALWWTAVDHTVDSGWTNRR